MITLYHDYFHHYYNSIMIISDFLLRSLPHRRYLHCCALPRSIHLRTGVQGGAIILFSSIVHSLRKLSIVNAVHIYSSSNGYMTLSSKKVVSYLGIALPALLPHARPLTGHRCTAGELIFFWNFISPGRSNVAVKLGDQNIDAVNQKYANFRVSSLPFVYQPQILARHRSAR